ncbi:MAG TPA: TonB-dependent receptor plug domain-containing protein [Longimicrobiaceae bacterium]
MARSPHLARGLALVLAATLAAACRGPENPAPDPGPSMPPPGVATARGDSLTAGDVGDLRVTRAEELFAGRFAGVEVLRLPTGGISVRIRGQTSVSLSTEPLYVIDGMPVNTEIGGGLSWLNPQDVQKIEVLKDPGSTAFYGVRGANGVILITTRH